MTTVTIGDEQWEGPTPEDAIGKARVDLDGRLSALLRQVAEARALLGSAA